MVRPPGAHAQGEALQIRSQSDAPRGHVAGSRPESRSPAKCDRAPLTIFHRAFLSHLDGDCDNPTVIIAILRQLVCSPTISGAPAGVPMAAGLDPIFPP
jgi:hypothetical protein